MLLILMLALLAPLGCRWRAPATVDGPEQSRFGENGFDRLTRTRLARDDFRFAFTGLDADAPMFDGRTAEPFFGSELLKAMREADVILLGETHLDPVAHRLQTRLVAEALAVGSGALSLEMLERPAQPVLNRLLARDAGSRAIQQALEGTTLKNWTSWEQFYLPAIQVALAQDRPVIAANAPRLYAMVARKRGYEYLRGLNTEQQTSFDLPPDNVDFSEYRERFYQFSGHGETPEGEAAPAIRPAREQMRAHQTTRPRFPSTRPSTSSATRSSDPSLDLTPTRDENSPEAFFDAQLVWDATMAQSILWAHRRYGEPIIHLVGSFHSDFDGGLTLLLRQADLNVLTVSFVPADGSRLRPEDLGRADVVIYTGAARQAIEQADAAATRPTTRSARRTGDRADDSDPVARRPAVLGRGPAAPATVPTRPTRTRPTTRSTQSPR